MTISITTKDNHFIIKGHNIKTQMLKVQSARWMSSYNCYAMPASPAGAKVLHSVLNDDVSYPLEYLDKFNIAKEIKEYGTDVAVFKSIKTTPWGHQKIAISYALALPSVMLAMDMGTGKSLCAVSIAGELNSKRTLILCPKSVINVWPNQFLTHSSLQWSVFAPRKGSVDVKARKLSKELEICDKLGQRAVVIVNYDAAWREPMGSFLKSCGFDLLILDESQKIKSHKGNASKYVGASLGSIPRKLALTGTPMPHSPKDIFAQYRALDPAIFGQFITKFEKRYCIKGGYGGYQVLGWQNEAELRERYQMISYEAKKKDCLDLPPEVDEILTVELSAKTLKYYAEMEKEFYLMVDEKVITAANAMTKMLRLQQITSGFCKSEDGDIVALGDDKLMVLKEILEDIDEKVTIFCRFRHDIELINKMARGLGRKVGELSGSRNDLTVDAKYPEDIDVLVVQIQSGGVGIDLSLSSVAIYYSLGLSLGDYLQSRSRLHRPGQKNKVTFIHLLAEKTIDEKVYKGLQKKEELIKFIMGER